MLRLHKGSRGRAGEGVGVWVWGEIAEALWRWLLLCIAILSGVAARGGYRLGGSPPPEDRELFVKWRRRQLWAALGELLSLPAFAAVWLMADRHYHLSPEILVGGCILTGALGFGFCLEAVQRLINRRIEGNA